MTFGRPGMISRASADAVPLPANIDDEYLFSTHGPVVHQPQGHPSVMEFYTRSLGLYRILHEILLSLYMPTNDEPPEDMVDYYYGKEREGELNIFELNRALTRWFEALPPHLKDITFDTNRTPKFLRQAIILRARYVQTSANVPLLVMNHFAKWPYFLDSCIFECSSSDLCSPDIVLQVKPKPIRVSFLRMTCSHNELPYSAQLCA